jgi:hypothetical protein
MKRSRTDKRHMSVVVPFHRGRATKHHRPPSLQHVVQDTTSPVPHSVREGGDGIVVFLDHVRRGHIGTPAPTHHAAGRPIPVTSINAQGSHVAAVTMRGALPPDGVTTASVDVPVHVGYSCDGAGGGYSHATITTGPASHRGGKMRGMRVPVSVLFVPEESEREEGEAGDGAPIRPVLRNYVIEMRTHSTTITEMHAGSDDNMYVHGMRAVVADIACQLCQCPSTSHEFPIIPMGMTVYDCLHTLRVMRLEIGMPSHTQPETAMRVAMQTRNSHRGKRIADVENFEPLYATVSRALENWWAMGVSKFCCDAVKNVRMDT